MEKKFTVLEAAKFLGVSKEAVYNRIRRGSLQTVVENGVKYVVLTKGNIREGNNTRKVESPSENAYVELLKSQLDEIKQKNIQLEQDKDRLIADKERLLIESKERIEAIYKERDEQLKAILTLANRPAIIANASSENQTMKNPFAYTNHTQLKSEDVDGYEDVDVLEEDENVDDIFDGYRDWKELRSYLKEKGFSKKDKEIISEKANKKTDQDSHSKDKNSKLFTKKGKKLKEILGS
ncbi:MAG: integrase [Sulfurospirillaceae bacterium]|nr:integrase [Sulfurospirillaceae bacterium]MDD3462052.1 integrase [Sulfurospirillaceae bacterium]